ncbi:MAG: PaaI family thioesterase [Alphaproteobacteria bacterium]|nr:PaaI family thioesterase [Alphaproteobacteria bacterium]MBV9692365.1 PaaI family thioesterase [Alphaproteobacteria bacterium]
MSPPDASQPLDGYAEIRLVDPFEIHVGPALAKGEKAARAYALRARDEHCNMRGIVHGGMLMTLADMMLGQALWDATDSAACVTMNMQVQFLKSARAGDVIEVAPRIVRRTRSLVFMAGDFTVGGQTVMTVQSVWKLLGQE